MEEETDLGSRQSWLAVVERAVARATRLLKMKKTMALEVGDGMEELTNLDATNLEEGDDLDEEGEAGSS